jgi:hypothetical protein
VARWCPSFGTGPTDEATARKLVKTGSVSGPEPDVGTSRLVAARKSSRRG